MESSQSTNYYNGIAVGILIKDTPGRDQSPGGREQENHAQVYSIGNSWELPKAPGRDSVRLDISQQLMRVKETGCSSL